MRMQSTKRARLEEQYTGVRLTDDDADNEAASAPAAGPAAGAGNGVYGSNRARPEVDDGVLDQRISDRMLKRIFTFAGIPVLTGLLLFPGFYYLVVRCLRVCARVPVPARAPA